MHEGKKHLCIPNTTANWYTQIYMWECDFCLSYWYSMMPCDALALSVFLFHSFVRLVCFVHCVAAAADTPPPLLSLMLLLLLRVTGIFRDLSAVAVIVARLLWYSVLVLTCRSLLSIWEFLLLRIVVVYVFFSSLFSFSALLCIAHSVCWCCSFVYAFFLRYIVYFEGPKTSFLWLFFEYKTPSF